jgi:hypothetical protein
VKHSLWFCQKTADVLAQLPLELIERKMFGEETPIVFVDEDGTPSKRNPWARER